MKIKIGTRLFLFIAGIATLSILIMVLAQRLSFDKGVRKLEKTALDNRLVIISDRLADRYSQHGSWDFLRGKRKISPRIIANRDNNSAVTVLEITLLDKNKQWLAGQKAPPKKLISKSIQYKGEIIGFVQAGVSKKFNHKREMNFAKKQLEALLWVALIVLILAAISAWYLSKNLVKPIKQLKKGTLQLESGDFDVTFNQSREDELGELGKNFNNLASALKKSKQAREQWVADISHELRTPIATLKAELEALEDGYRPLNNDAVKSLSDEVNRLEILVNDLYQLTQADSGVLTFNFTLINLKSLITETVSQFSERFNEHPLSVELNLADNVKLDADSNRLKQLLANLFENSMRYTDPNGTLKIALKQYGSHLEIIIEDSAPSVPQEALPLLFERLYRVDSSRNRATGSSGLGLAICKSIVDAHNGTIEAKLSELGGIAITISFPQNFEKESHKKGTKA